MHRRVMQVFDAARIVVRDGRIPRPLRWGGAFALLPIPGPVDEAALLVVGVVLWLFYRDQFREAWEAARTPTANEALAMDVDMRGSRRRRWIAVAMTTIAVAAALVVFAKLVGRVYYDPAVAAVAGSGSVPDFGVFYLAADAVRHLGDPYALGLPQGWLGYVYPPLLAFAMTPLTLLPFQTAVTVWALLSILSIVVALRILGVRDWRCYPIALLWPFTREALEFGTIDAPLVLALAAAWRYRDVPIRASASAGFLIAVKLFLWPLALWFALTRRARTAAGVVAAAALLVLVPWAFIHFQGLATYPDLLRQVAGQQDGTYSIASVIAELGFASKFAGTVSIVVGVCLLYLAYRASGERGQGERARDARSFTLTITAALALTPIVWNHYLLLLLVPVAIARPRLSVLWFVPLALNGLYLVHGYGPSPDGVMPLVALLGLVAVTITLALEAQSERTSRAVKPVWVKATPVIAPGLAVLAVLLLIFVALPERFNDKPYNPLGRDTSMVQRTQ
jgi:hypothetical protein